MKIRVSIAAFAVALIAGLANAQNWQENANAQWFHDEVKADRTITAEDLTSVDDVTAGDDLSVTDDATITDALTVNGNTALGNATGDTVTVTAWVQALTIVGATTLGNDTNDVIKATLYDGSNGNTNGLVSGQFYLTNKVIRVY